MRFAIGLTCIAVLGACARDAPPQTTIQNTTSPASSCASSVATMIANTRAMDPKHDSWDDETASNIRAVLANRCVEDHWTAEAQTCLAAAKTEDAEHACWKQKLTGDQRDKADRVVDAIDHASRRRSSDERQAKVDPDASVGESALAAAREFTDRLCTCADHKDQACSEKVQQDMQKWAQDNATKFKDYKPTDAEMKESAEIAKRMSDCMQAMMSP